MPGRVNTKFVILLSAVLVLLPLTLVGYYYAVVRQSPEELIHQGDQHMDDNQPRRALESYAKALNQRRTDVGLIEKYLDALAITPVRDQLEAQRYLEQMHSWNRQLVDSQPNNHELRERHYQFITMLAREFNQVQQYGQLYELASSHLQSHPDDVLARRYRGLAQLQRMSPNMTRDDQLQVRDDLTFALEHDVHDAEVLHGLARWHLREADRLAGVGATSAAIQSMRDLGLDFSRQMLAEDPQDHDRLAKHLAVLTGLPEHMRDTEQIRAAVADLEQQLLQDPQPRDVVMATIQTMLRVEATPSDEQGDNPALRQTLQRARGLLEAAVQAHPQELAYRTMLARLLVQVGEQDQAVALLEEMRDLSSNLPAIAYLVSREHQVQGLLTLADLLWVQAVTSADTDQRDALLNRAEQLVAEVTAIINEAPPVLLMSAKIAMVRGEMRKAATDVERAIEGVNGIQPEAYRLAARIHRQLGNWGTAAQRLEALVNQPGDQTAVRLELVDIYLGNRQPDAASPHLEHVLANQPNHAGALQRRAQLLVQQNRAEEAIQAYVQLDPIQNPEIMRPLMQLYLRTGNQAEGLAMLRRRLETAPEDLAALQMLAALTEDDQEREQVLARAREAGGDPALLDMLHQRGTDETVDMRDFVEQLTTRQDPLDAALLRAQMFRETGDTEKAEAAFQEAARLAPDDPRVIERQFEMALADQNFDAAARLVERAVRLNTDFAGGAFYRGRLAAARGELPLAVGYYEQGLRTQPIYAEGWRQLGDLYVQSQSLRKAVEAYDKAVAQQPSNVAALRNLAAVREQLGDTTAALGHLREALRYQPSNRELISFYLSFEQRYGNAERAVALRTQLAEADPNDANNRRALALLLAQQEQFDEARAAIDALVQQTDAGLENTFTRATIERLAGETERGEQTIMDYLTRRGEDVDATDYVMLAQYRLAANDGPGTMAAYRQARRLEDPVARPVTRQLADLLFDRGAFNDAVPLYRELHEQSPDEQQVTLRLAEALLNIQEHEAARALLQGIPEDLAEARALRAMLARIDGDTQTAHRLFTQALQGQPRTRPLLYYQRARLLYEDEQRVQPAIQDLNAALTENPDFLPARELLVQIQLNSGQRDDAMRELRTLLSRMPQHREARLQLFSLYMAGGDHRAAAALAEQGAALAPQDVTWLRSMAQVAAVRGQIDQAISHLTQVIDLDPSAGNVATLAALLLQHDRAAQARDLLYDHVELRSQQPLLQAMWAQALAGSGDQERATRAFLLALRRAATPNQARQFAVQMSRSLGADAALDALLSETSELEADIQTLAAVQIELESNRGASAVSRLEASGRPAAEPWALAHDELMAIALYQQQDYPRARQAYERVLAAQPQNVGALNNLAFLLTDNMNDPAAALPLAERAAALSPDDARVLDTLGWTQYKAGQVNLGRQTLHRSVELTALPANCLHLGQIYWDLEQKDEARQWLEQTVRLAEQANDRHVQTQAGQLLERLTSP